MFICIFDWKTNNFDFERQTFKWNTAKFENVLSREKTINNMLKPILLHQIQRWFDQKQQFSFKFMLLIQMFLTRTGNKNYKKQNNR